MALPEFTEKFSSNELESIQKSGSIDSNRDGFNNILLSFEQTSVSSSLLSFPLKNIVYDSNYVESFFETKFTEFVEN